jgi:hypothetical protein
MAVQPWARRHAADGSHAADGRSSTDAGIATRTDGGVRTGDDAASPPDGPSSTLDGQTTAPMGVSLGGAGNFVILAKSGISTVPTSAVTGNIGVSPAAATGFSFPRTTAHLEGIVLGKTLIALKTGASINGRLFAQTAVSLEGSTVVEPAP